MRPPPILYKYLTSDRLDVLARKRIRLTQPGRFNDPFESYPFVGEVPRGRSLQDSFDDVFRAAQRGQSVTPDAMQAAFLFTFLNKVVVLALTEEPASILMWAHYANNHDGYVLGFDTTSAIFKPSSPLDSLADRMSLDELQPVQYQAQRPETGFALMGDDQAPFTKSPDWSYEREWRIRKHVDGAVQVLDGGAAFPVYLFEFSAAAIRQVVIGCRMQSTTRAKFLEVLAQPEYQHVEVLEAWPHPMEFRMQLLPYQSRKPLATTVKNVIHDVPPERVQLIMQMWANMGAAEVDKIRQPDGNWTVVALVRE